MRRSGIGLGVHEPEPYVNTFQSGMCGISAHLIRNTREFRLVELSSTSICRDRLLVGDRIQSRFISLSKTKTDSIHAPAVFVTGAISVFNPEDYTDMVRGPNRRRERRLLRPKWACTTPRRRRPVPQVAQFSQEFRLSSNFDGPFTSTGRNFLRYDTKKSTTSSSTPYMWGAQATRRSLGKPGSGHY